MSKYIGPIWRKSRALNFPLLGGKEFSRGKKRKTIPGIHGGKRKRYSAYALQNKEKQKIRFRYGLRENQLYNLFIKVKDKKGEAGDNLLISCESRLDNVVFRSGIVNTLGFARQLVSHGHALVDGKKVTIPSFRLKPGQTISLKKEKMAENKLIKDSLAQNAKIPSFLDFKRKGTEININFSRYPNSDELEKGIDTSLVVEWYNRKI